ncbi:MAG: phosphoglycerate mutase [Planctomycetes bacterium]|nr:phosphoglycerate mutase [Planctomycetota bacterium]
MDGLGGLPDPATGKTELESARTPTLDRLARSASMGLGEIAGPGITPGSGPGHLALFGYDPHEHVIGRGALSAVGVGMSLGDGAVAARGNLCTLDAGGLISDRRAGRMATAETARRLAMPGRLSFGDVSVELAPERDYRFVAVFRGPGLSGDVLDTDPQKEGVAPRDPAPSRDTPSAHKTVDAAKRLVAALREAWRGEKAGNGALLRGFSARPTLDPFRERYGLKAGCAAVYPMYRGLASLAGMELLGTPADVAGAVGEARGAAGRLDFLFFHFKATDSAGEDGDFRRKVAAIEEADGALARILESGFDVIAVTGDHSTPSRMKGHSWHPVPVLIGGPGAFPTLPEPRFHERDCLRGWLGRFPMKDLMTYLLAEAGRLEKYGA